MRCIAIAALFGAAVFAPARAADNAVLIQIASDGGYRVWHSEGETNFSNDELAVLETSATPEGGAEVATAAGAATAVAGEDAILVFVPGARRDKTVLVERDGCNGVNQWHSAGNTLLSDEQLTDIVQAALPGGGRNVRIGANYAKGFLTKLGVRAVIWQPVTR